MRFEINQNSLFLDLAAMLQAYGRRVILPARLELDREYAARRAAGSSTGRSSDSQTFAALNVEMHYDLDK